jgi:hypothetical protein
MLGAPASGLAVEVFAGSIAQAVVEVVTPGPLLDIHRKNNYRSARHRATSTPNPDTVMGNATAVPIKRTHGAAPVNILRWRMLNHTVFSLDLNNTLHFKITKAQQELECCLLSSSPTGPR